MIFGQGKTQVQNAREKDGFSTTETTRVPGKTLVKLSTQMYLIHFYYHMLELMIHMILIIKYHWNDGYKHYLVQYLLIGLALNLV